MNDAAVLRDILRVNHAGEVGAVRIYRLQIAIGGALFGMVTALLGRDAILTCTEAVERTVHAHMNDQITWLAARDAALSRVIATIRDQEVDHLDHAIRAGGKRSRWLDWLVGGTTGMLVWLSTYGASARLARSIG